MKISVKLIPWIIIIILGVIIFFLRSCQHCPSCPEVKIDTVIVVKYDTVERIVYVEKPVPYQVIIPSNVDYNWDSLAYENLFNAFYSKNIYLDTLLNDTSAFISVRDTITENRIGFRKLYFLNKRPTMIETTITNVYGDTTRKRIKLFVGLTIGRKFEEFTLGPSLMLVTKKEHAYSLQFDPFYKCVYGTIYYKIKFRRK